MHYWYCEIFMSCMRGNIQKYCIRDIPSVWSPSHTLTSLQTDFFPFYYSSKLKRVAQWGSLHFRTSFLSFVMQLMKCKTSKVSNTLWAMIGSFTQGHITTYISSLNTTRFFLYNFLLDSMWIDKFDVFCTWISMWVILSSLLTTIKWLLTCTNLWTLFTCL